MAQSVKWWLTLGFGSGHDLTVRGLEPHVRLFADSMEACLRFPPTLPLSLPSPTRAFSVSLKINKLKKINNSRTLLCVQHWEYSGEQALEGAYIYLGETDNKELSKQDKKC